MNQENFDRQIDIKELFLILWDKKIFISCLTSVFAICSVIYALSTPNIYTSKALLAPTTSDNTLSSRLGAFSSIASIGGLSLPPESVSKSQEAVERIKSFEFFSQYFLPNIKLEHLMAIEKWDAEKNIIIYDKNIFDEVNQKWIRGEAGSKKMIPSNQEAYKKFKDLISVTESATTSFISISIDHESPFIAKRWIEIVISNINESMREQDIIDAQNSIDFLNELVTSTNIQTIKDAISNLLESQMQILMMASSNEAYVFEFIDSPYVPEEKSRPSRALICILGTIFGVVVSIILVLFRKFILSQEDT